MALGVLGLILYVVAAVSFGLETVSTDTANLARRLGVMEGVVAIITL